MDYKAITPRTGCVQVGSCLVTVYRLDEGDLVLVDSGSRETSDLVASIRSRGLKVRAILTTHLHPDHLANHRLCQDTWGSRVYAGEGELAFVQNRAVLEAAYSMSPDQARAYAQSLVSEDYPVSPLGYEAQEAEIEGSTFRVLHLPGHSADHLGYVTPDGVCCVGDAMLSDMLLRGAKLPYCYDLPEYFHSLHRLSRTQYPYYVLAHSQVLAGEDLPEYLNRNISKELQLLLDLLDLLDGPSDCTSFSRRVLLAKQVSGTLESAPILKHLVLPRIFCLAQWKYVTLGEHAALVPGPRPKPDYEHLMQYAALRCLR